MVGVLHKVATALVLAIGVVHTAATAVFYDALTEAAVWFAGAGLGGIFIAFLNMGLWSRHVTKAARRLVTAANVLFLAWLAVGVTATPTLPSALVASVGAVMVVTALMLPPGAT